MFADDLAPDRVPSIRVTRAAPHVGQPRATTARYLATGADTITIELDDQDRPPPNELRIAEATAVTSVGMAAGSTVR